MTTRLSREQRTERNRGLVLAAAREVFLDRGYHAATLEDIAERAGFSKGIVYSQFESKADLFLALLDARIADRANENAELVRDLSGEAGIRAIIEHGTRLARSDPRWSLALMEFRIHAARDPDLRARYAAAHEVTITRVAALFDELYERAGRRPPQPSPMLARFMLALAAGLDLERASDPSTEADAIVESVISGMFTPRPAPVRRRHRKERP